MQNPLALQDALNRRIFLRHATSGIGAASLGMLLRGNARAQDNTPGSAQIGGLAGFPNHTPRAKRVIYLFQSGAPSQMDLFDPKPAMEKERGKDLPDSIRMGQRLTGMTAGQSKFPVAPSMFKFQQHGQSGLWLSELLPHLSKVADDLCMIHSLHTEAINHDPAITFMQTGSQLAGRPSIGSWVSYGLGSENRDLPAYIVLTSFGSGRKDDQPLYDRLWGAGFLPAKYQGVKFRNQGEAVLYLQNPPGVDPALRRESLDRLAALNKEHHATLNDPEIQTRIAQYEMAFRMQASVPDLADLAKEPANVLESYGPDVKKPGSFAHTALTARRLVQRGVRFVQVYHNNWDHHGNLTGRMKDQCRDVDQPCWALINDLKRLGLFDETLVIWGGEFGRTIYSQGGISKDKEGKTNYGRDHHPRCFSMWMAGGGSKGGTVYGETDDFSYNITKDPVHVRDLHATVLRLLGIDHERFSYRFQGLDQRLTGVEKANIIKELIA
jgi:hypothetical protein